MNSEQLFTQVVTAAAADDLRRLLAFWEHVVWPIPEADFGEQHPVFPSAVHAALALDALGEERMTRAQQLETARRLLLGMNRQEVRA